MSRTRDKRKFSWRLSLGHAYSQRVVARKNNDAQFAPVPAPASLRDYEGLWVAVLNGKVIAAAHTSRELVRELAKIGPEGRGATMQRVPTRERGLLVGLG